MKTIIKILTLFTLALFCAPVHAQKSALLWATYFGGDTTASGNGVATDDSGNVYLTGTTFSDTGLATVGAYQTSCNNVYGVIFLAKFTSSGNLLWATYYGNGWENAGGVTVDISGNIYITGVTNSMSGIATYGAYQTSFLGINATYLAKFSPSGALLWGTYYGGGSNEGGVAITTDSLGNLYLSGVTSDTFHIATFGAYQTSYSGGDDDAYLAKFSPSGTLLWGTYYGGNKFDEADGLAMDKSGNLYLSGITYSTSGIATSGAYQVSYKGSGDDFLAKFNLSGSMLWATYFGDSCDGSLVTTDFLGNVYITGDTYATSSIATRGAYQTVGDEKNDDVILAKFNPSGNLLWATYYGGSGIETAGGIVTDKQGNVYISGLTNSTSHIATSGAYQTFNAGGNDTYLAKFSSKGGLLWATYYGGYSNDNGGTIAIDSFGDVYDAGLTNSTSHIATSGAYQISCNGNAGAAFLAKFNIKTYYGDVGISSITSPKVNFCADSIPVKVQLKNYNLDTLKAVKINWKINNISQATYNWTGNLVSGGAVAVTIGNYNFASGIDTIIAWTTPVGFFDTISGNDTSKVIDTVHSLPQAITGNDKSVCKGDSAVIGGNAVSGNIYSWASKPQGYTSSNATVRIAPTITTTYYLTETSQAGCSTSASVVITVNPLPDASFTYKTSNDKVKFIPTNSTYIAYSWAFGDGDTSNIVSPSHPYPNGTYTVSLTVTNQSGCKAMYKTTDTINYSGIFSAYEQIAGLKISPNPFTSEFSITYSLPKQSQVNATIYDVTGRQICILFNGSQSAGLQEININGSDYSKGVYLLKIEINNERITNKIIKIN